MQSIPGSLYSWKLPEHHWKLQVSLQQWLCSNRRGEELHRYDWQVAETVFTLFKWNIAPMIGEQAINVLLLFRYRWVPHLPGLVWPRHLRQHTRKFWVWMFWRLRKWIHDDEELHGYETHRILNDGLKERFSLSLLIFFLFFFPSIFSFLSPDRLWWMWKEPNVVSRRNLSEHRRELWMWMSHWILTQHRWLCMWRWISLSLTYTQTRISLHYYFEVTLCLTVYFLFAGPVRCERVPAEWKSVQEWPVCQHARNLPVHLWYWLSGHTRQAGLCRWVDRTLISLFMCRVHNYKGMKLDCGTSFCRHWWMYHYEWRLRNPLYQFRGQLWVQLQWRLCSYAWPQDLCR